MGADVLATQGARASANIILTMLNRINSVPHINIITEVCITSSYLISFNLILPLSFHADGAYWSCLSLTTYPICCQEQNDLSLIFTYFSLSFFAEIGYWSYLNPTTYPTSCQEYYNWGLRINGAYNIDTDGEEGNTAPVVTLCDFTGMDTSKCLTIWCCYEGVGVPDLLIYVNHP